jgi:uncharacterized GH25 family protein
MKKASTVALLLILLGLTAAAAPPYKDKDNQVGRLVTGKVLDRQDSPLPNAVVYLTNTRTRNIKTYIVGETGEYRFPALSPNIDYEVYAQFNGHKSDTKTVSQFDNRQIVNIVLKVDAK